MTASLRILSSKADSNTWESFTRSELKLNQESPRSDIFRKRATKPLLKQKHRQKHLIWAKEKKNWTVAQCSKVLFSDESQCCISFVNQGPRVWRKSGEAQNPCSWSPVWSFHSQWWFEPPCHLLVLVHCVFWSPQSTIIYQEILEHFMLPSADKIYEMLISFSSRTCPHCQRYKKPVQWPCVTVLDWPANSPDLKARESRWETPDPTIQICWRPLSKHPVRHYTWADCLYAALHWCSHSLNQVLSA